jgi:pimeloyl-ACP methyl ester carboxylesterase
MKRKMLLPLLIFLSIVVWGQEGTTIYLLPGQGADFRSFKNINFPPAYSIHPIFYDVPPAGATMQEYAQQLASQIDTSKPFILLGVSLGGMLATEMSTFLNPEQVVVISSAKCRFELPTRYTFQQYIPLYKAVSPNLSKRGALWLQPIVEPDRNKERATCVAMLEDKDPLFLRRTIEMIIEWEREEAPEGIVHIHGDKDHTIPFRNVKSTHRLSGGSHMMVLTKGEEVSQVLEQIL